MAYNSQHAWRMATLRISRGGGRETGAYISHHAFPEDYNSQRAPRPSQGHRAPPEPAPSTPITAQPGTCTGGVYSFHNKGSPHPKVGVRSSVFTEIVAKSLKKGGSGSSVCTHGRSSRTALSPGVSRCACLTVFIYRNYRNFIYSFLCGPIRQISPYL